MYQKDSFDARVNFLIGIVQSNLNLLPGLLTLATRWPRRSTTSWPLTTWWPPWHPWWPWALGQLGTYWPHTHQTEPSDSLESGGHFNVPLAFLAAVESLDGHEAC